MNKLYFGDNLDILKQLNKEHPNGFIDLIYIDPPFNSKRDYNVLFESIKASDATAQKQAFADTWSNVSYIDTLNELHALDLDLYSFIHALDMVRISKAAISYLTTMAIRIYYIHKVLKDTGTFYLHCDPAMSHYLKIVCDLIFGERNFRNEISWKRANPKSNNMNNWVNNRDVILRYTKTNTYTFNKIFGQHDESYVNKAYKYKDLDGRRYRLLPLLNPNDNRPNLTYEFLGVTKVWRWTQERMEQAYRDGLVVQLKPGAVPQYKLYLEDSKGKVITNDWNDILPASGSEVLGYPTQKPLALLERIIESSSNKGDIVADFFCGCGTTIAAAQKLNRQWLGVDISHLAVKLMVDRLIKPYSSKSRIKAILDNIEIKGMPKDIASARELAENTNRGRFGFQEWIIEVMLGGVCNHKKVADGGYDGYIIFEKAGKDRGVILIEVKSGKVNVKNIREFIHVVEFNQADIGAFICFDDTITKEMLREAKLQGHFDQEHFGDRISKIQIISVEDLFDGRGIKLPEYFYRVTTFKEASEKLETVENSFSLFDQNK